VKKSFRHIRSSFSLHDYYITIHYVMSLALCSVVRKLFNTDKRSGAVSKGREKRNTSILMKKANCGNSQLLSNFTKTVVSVLILLILRLKRAFQSCPVSSIWTSHLNLYSLYACGFFKPHLFELDLYQKKVDLQQEMWRRRESNPYVRIESPAH
jgi:hypothetical protein